MLKEVLKLLVNFQVYTVPHREDIVTLSPYLNVSRNVVIVTKKGLISCTDTNIMDRSLDRRNLVQVSEESFLFSPFIKKDVCNKILSTFNLKVDGQECSISN